MIRCCIFDLDGTLLSTLDTITYHLNSTLLSFGLRKITVDDCAVFIGNGARKLVERAIKASGEYSDELRDKVLSVYNEAYNFDPLPLTEPYPGIIELVNKLYDSGVHLGVVTNKPEITARQLISYFFGDKFISVIGGRPGACLKPDPADSLSLIESIGVEASKTAFIGDTYVDIQTGKNMGAALSVGVLWGFRDEDELSRAGADVIVSDTDELWEVLKNAK